MKIHVKVDRCEFDRAVEAVGDDPYDYRTLCRNCPVAMAVKTALAGTRFDGYVPSVTGGEVVVYEGGSLTAAEVAAASLPEEAHRVIVGFDKLKLGNTYAYGGAAAKCDPQFVEAEFDLELVEPGDPL